MAGPITWRNVSGPALPDVGRAMQAASLGFNGGFDILGKVIKDREAIDASNTLITQENAKNGFLDAVAKYKTPEELAAAQPELDQLRTALDPRSRAAVRGTEEVRTAALRTQMQDAWKYDNAVVDQREAPVRDAYLAAVAKGDVLTANIIESGNPDLRNKAPLAQAFADGQQKIVTQGRDATRFANDQEAEKRKVAEELFKAETRPLEVQGLQSRLLTEAQQRAASRATVDAQNESILNSRATRTRAETEQTNARQAARLKAALEGNLYSEGILKSGDTESLYKLMKDNDIGGTSKDSDAVDKRAKVIGMVSTMAKNGIEVSYTGDDGKEVKERVRDLPLGAVKAAILASQDQPLSWNGGWADTFRENLANALKASSMQPVIDAAGNNVTNPDGTPKLRLANKAVDDRIAFQAIQRAALEAAAAGGTTKPKKPK